MSPSQGVPDKLEDRVLKAGLKAVHAAINTIYEGLKQPNALNLLYDAKLKKYLYSVDSWAEKSGRETLTEALGDSVHLLGEETGEETSSETQITGLLDMLDGSDLLARNLGNWCSALTLYRLGDEGRIFTAVIGTHRGDLYYTNPSAPGAWVMTPNPKEVLQTSSQVEVETKVIRLRDASIAFYGQKPGKLLSFLGRERLKRRFEEIAAEANEKKRSPDIPLMRLYNLGGNPMMMALIKGQIDAVFDLDGQLCHDVVPGFVIALRAGAILKDLDSSQDITEDRILQTLRDPKNKFRYVMANNRELAEELVTLAAKTNA